MEREFQSMFLGGEGSDTFSPALSLGKTTVDDWFDAFCSGMSFQSLLSLNQEKNLLSSSSSSMDYAYGDSPLGLPALPESVTPATFSFFAEDFPAIQQNQLIPETFGFSSGDFTAIQQKQVNQCSVNKASKTSNIPATFGFFSDDFPAIYQKEPGELKSVDFASSEKLKMPKVEPSNYYEEINEVSTEPFNFISKISDPMTNLCDSSFQQLPDLRSYEHIHDFAFGESSRKRSKTFSPSPDSYALQSIFKQFQLPQEIKPPPPATVPQISQARRRRQRISDRIRSLQKVLPWDKKMDTATMFEEAYKYIKFLQAQISILQCMPIDSSIQNPGNVNAYGRLGRLNRQQLLQVLVNSPVAQTVLYSRGCCVYSIEQLIMMKKIAEMNALYQQQIVLDPSVLS